MEYSEDIFDSGQHEDGLYKFKSIKDHRDPYTSTDQEYLGSSYNLLIEWETGEMTWEPLSNIIADASYSCAVYVDGSAICIQNPQASCDTLKRTIQTQAKGCLAQSVTTLDVDILEMKMEPLSKT